MRALILGASLLALAACGRSQPGLDQTGAQPDLPDQRQTLLPPMKIATHAGWGNEKPSAPAGFSVTAFATGLAIPRQMLVLPNGDILLAGQRTLRDGHGHGEHTAFIWLQRTDSEWGGGRPGGAARGRHRRRGAARCPGR